MSKEIRIYVEGGGNSRLTQGPLRKGFDAFLQPFKNKARTKGIHFQIIMCGGCNDTFQNFLLAIKTHRDAINVLLVDAEKKVDEGNSNADHLRRRKWDLPQTVNPNYHLMVQAMEVLFVADKGALSQYYGKNFRHSALPLNANLEDVTVSQLMSALKNATRETTAGEYRKIQHAAKLLPQLDVLKVRTALPHCNQFFQFLESVL